MVFNWFMAFMKILFGGKEWPSMQTFFVVSVLHSKVLAKRNYLLYAPSEKWLANGFTVVYFFFSF